MSQPDTATPPHKGSAFWLSFIAVVVANFLSALDFIAVAIAVPTMTHDLNGKDNFVWIGAAYGLASTAILPFSSRLADIFGRRPIMLIAITIFLVGSALAGAAQNMSWLIAARTVQGIGGGSILNLGSVIVGDLVSLAERGTYQGIVILAWAVAGSVGPIISGALAQDASWRWLFCMIFCAMIGRHADLVAHADLNLPLAGISFIFVALFLRVRTPEGSMSSKLSRVDWIGNLIIIAGTSLALVALTWGGIRFSWSSSHVLGPLIAGVLLIFTFFVYEALVPREPTTPVDVLKNRTAFSGYLTTFIHGIIGMSAMFYLPVYFQACKDASPLLSGVYVLPVTLPCAFVALVAGIVIKKTEKYRPINFAGWILMLIGFGLCTLLKAGSPMAVWVIIQLVVSSGLGIIWGVTVFPILAAIRVERFASAIAFWNFLRTFAQTWGVTISATILQNELKKYLPPTFAAQFPDGVEIAYAAIPVIPTLDDGLRAEVHVAFAQSLSVVWKVMTGLAGAGLLVNFMLKEIPMHTSRDYRYALQDEPATELHSKGSSSEIAESGCNKTTV
ncbi:iron permease [Earliella scabrosa]|nr:iron permease [Earliella scabrosa]